MNYYKCPECGCTYLRDSNKKEMESYCEKFDKKVIFKKIKEKDIFNHNYRGKSE